MRRIFLANIMVNLLIGKVKMVLEWCEGENEDMDRLAMGDPMTLHALQRCGFAQILLHIKHDSASSAARGIGAFMGP